MEPELKSSLFENQFGRLLLEHDLDEASFAELCSILSEVAVVWKNTTQIDKDVVYFLFELFTIMHYKLTQSIQGLTEKDRGDLQQMFGEFDRLVLGKCLA